MNKLTVLLLVLSPFVVQAHQLATCKIFEWDKELRMEISMGEHHIIEAIEKQFPFLQDNASQEEIDDCIVEYIHENLDVDFNQKETDFNYQAISSHRGYLIVEGNFDIRPEEIKSAIVKNSLLIKEVDYHSNIVEFNLKNQLRSFRLHKNRQQAIIEKL